MIRSWRPLIAGVALGALVATACADDPGPDAPPAEDPGSGEADLESRPDLGSFLPDDRGEPPGALVVEDVVDGDGEAAADGNVLTVHYVGAAWSTGAEFDASWARGQTYTFELGAGAVIAGWDQGLVGMREGGRRLLVIPPDLAYADRGAAGVIAPGETLLFVVDLVDVRAGP